MAIIIVSSSVDNKIKNCDLILVTVKDFFLVEKKKVREDERREEKK